MVPFDTQDLNGVVYVWCGSKADHEDATLAEEIAYTMYKVGCESVRRLHIQCTRWDVRV